MCCFILAPADYESVVMQFEIPTGDNVGSFYCSNITIKDEEIFEHDESFQVLLTSNNDFVMVEPNSSAMATITNDDSKN